MTPDAGRPRGGNPEADQTTDGVLAKTNGTAKTSKPTLRVFRNPGQRKQDDLSALKAEDVAARLEAERSAQEPPEDDGRPFADRAALDPDAAPEGPQGHPTRLPVLRVADVEAENVTWLWEGRLPKGKLAILDGDPGNGKSTITADLAARLTTGKPMPDGTPGPSGGPVKVLLLSAEDGVADTIRPRLEAAGADLELVLVHDDSEGLLSLPGDVEALEALVVAKGIGLVIIDPLSAYIGGKHDVYKEQDVRQVTTPLAKMAERTGVAFLGIRHLTKGGGPNAKYRGGGSIGIIGAARVALMVGIDPDDPSRRVLAVTKCNLAPEAPSLAYRIASAERSSLVQWEGVTGHRADDLVATPTEDTPGARTAAERFLTDALAEGPLPAAEVKRRATEAGIAESALHRARPKVGVDTQRKGYGGGSVWELQSSVSVAATTDTNETNDTNDTNDPQSSLYLDGKTPTGFPLVQDLPLGKVGTCRVCRSSTVTTDAEGPVHPDCLTPTTELNSNRSN